MKEPPTVDADCQMDSHRNLDDIFDYIGRQNRNPEAAAKVLRQIDGKCSSYSRQPHMGSNRPDLGENVRCFTVGSYVVVYRPIVDGIQVLTVAHGSRDVATILRGLFDPELK